MAVEAARLKEIRRITLDLYNRSSEQNKSLKNILEQNKSLKNILAEQFF